MRSVWSHSQSQVVCCLALVLLAGSLLSWNMALQSRGSFLMALTIMRACLCIHVLILWQSEQLWIGLLERKYNWLVHCLIGCPLKCHINCVYDFVSPIAQESPCLAIEVLQGHNSAMLCPSPGLAPDTQGNGLCWILWQKALARDNPFIIICATRHIKDCQPPAHTNEQKVVSVTLMALGIFSSYSL